MSEGPNRRLLARCAACGRNFETRRYGRQRCTVCGAEVDLAPPPGEPLPPLEEAPALPPPPEEPVPREVAPSPVAPVQSPPDAPEAEDAGRDDRPQEPHQDLLPAWEAGEGGSLARAVRTLRDLFSAPVEFFARLKPAPAGRSVIFGMLLSTLAVAAFAGYGLWALGFNRQEALAALRLTPEMLAAGMSPEGVLATLQEALGWALLLSPVLGLLNLLLTALLYHGGIVLVAKQPAGFGATLRATAYGSAPLVLSVLPLIGLLLGSLWTLVLQIVALSQAHRLTPWRAALAVTLPITLLMLLAATLIPRL
jgi:hypothetical protein